MRLMTGLLPSRRVVFREEKRSIRRAGATIARQDRGRKVPSVDVTVSSHATWTGAGKLRLRRCGGQTSVPFLFTRIHLETEAAWGSFLRPRSSGRGSTLDTTVRVRRTNFPTPGG